MTVEEVRELEYKYRTYEEGYDQFNLCPAIDAYIEWHSKALILFSEYFDSQNEDFISFKELDNDRNGYGLHDNFKQIYSRYNLMMHKIEQECKQESLVDEQKNAKPPMVFISHSSKDKDFVEALVDLLEDIGMTSETLFCSSVPGYGVGLSKDIFETLRKLFHNHELYMIFVHSPRYYESTVSLNEMGAAWVLHTKCCSILTSDMDFAKMSGVINGNFISIKVNQDEASARLNELKDEIIKTFSLPIVDNNRWERKRNSFLKIVNAIVEQGKTSEIRQSSISNIIDEEYKRLLIEKMKREEEELKQAFIRGNLIKAERGYKLHIFNSGKAKATNVKVEWLNESDRIHIRGDFNIGDLTAQNKRVYYLHVGVGHPNIIHLRYTWSDDLNAENIYEEKLQFA